MLDKMILPKQDHRPSLLSCFKSASSTLGTLHQRGRVGGSSQEATLTLLELPWVSKTCCQGNPYMMVSATGYLRRIGTSKAAVGGIQRKHLP